MMAIDEYLCQVGSHDSVFTRGVTAGIALLIAKLIVAGATIDTVLYLPEQHLGIVRSILTGYPVGLKVLEVYPPSNFSLRFVRLRVWVDPLAWKVWGDYLATAA